MNWLAVELEDALEDASGVQFRVHGANVRRCRETASGTAPDRGALAVRLLPAHGRARDRAHARGRDGRGAQPRVRDARGGGGARSSPSWPDGGGAVRIGGPVAPQSVVALGEFDDPAEAGTAGGRARSARSTPTPRTSRCGGCGCTPATRAGRPGSSTTSSSRAPGSSRPRSADDPFSDGDIWSRRAPAQGRRATACWRRCRRTRRSTDSAAAAHGAGDRLRPRPVALGGHVHAVARQPVRVLPNHARPVDHPQVLARPRLLRRGPGCSPA